MQGKFQDIEEACMRGVELTMGFRGMLVYYTVSKPTNRAVHHIKEDVLQDAADQADHDQARP